MKIVIDIPETIYKAIKEETYCGILDADVYYAIKDGTPLPKGHSDLIDRDKLLKELKESAKYYSENSREESLNYMDRVIVKEQPVVIERW